MGVCARVCAHAPVCVCVCVYLWSLSPVGVDWLHHGQQFLSPPSGYVLSASRSAWPSSLDSQGLLNAGCRSSSGVFPGLAAC